MSSPNKGTSPLEEEEEKIEDGPESTSLNTVDEAVPSSPSSSTGKRVTWPNIAKKTPSPQRRLSAVSKMYDIDGMYLVLMICVTLDISYALLILTSSQHIHAFSLSSLYR